VIYPAADEVLVAFRYSTEPGPEIAEGRNLVSIWEALTLMLMCEWWLGAQAATFGNAKYDPHTLSQAPVGHGKRVLSKFTLIYNARFPL
jgi:hypothetical protein